MVNCVQLKPQQSPDPVELWNKMTLRNPSYYTIVTCQDFFCSFSGPKCHLQVLQTMSDIQLKNYKTQIGARKCEPWSREEMVNRSKLGDCRYVAIIRQDFKIPVIKNVIRCSRKSKHAE